LVEKKRKEDYLERSFASKRGWKHHLHLALPNHARRKVPPLYSKELKHCKISYHIRKKNLILYSCQQSVNFFTNCPGFWKKISTKNGVSKASL
jgi:hypothetical protein